MAATAEQEAGLPRYAPELNDSEQSWHDLEIVEDRYNAGSLIITSQVPVDRWHDIVGNPTLADAILDRFIHNAHRIELKGKHSAWAAVGVSPGRLLA